MGTVNPGHFDWSARLVDDNCAFVSCEYSRNEFVGLARQSVSFHTLECRERKKIA